MQVEVSKVQTAHFTHLLHGEQVDVDTLIRCAAHHFLARANLPNGRLLYFDILNDLLSHQVQVFHVLLVQHLLVHVHRRLWVLLLPFDLCHELLLVSCIALSNHLFASILTLHSIGVKPLVVLKDRLGLQLLRLESVLLHLYLHVESLDH